VTDVGVIEGAQVILPESPYPQRTKDKVCIVGFADSSRGDTPFDDHSMEFWGLNRLHTVMGEDQHWDRYFQIHDWNQAHGEDQEHKTWLEEWGGPVYMRPEDGQVVPNAQPFPVVDILRDFRPYITNTVSWLIALAIAMEFREIHLYGIDMAQDALLHAEYRAQRPSCEYFLGYAEGKGIEVFVSPASDLLKATHLYGIEDGGVWTQKMLARQNELGNRKNEAKNQLAQLEANVAQVTAAINQFDGAMQDNQYWMTNWSPNLVEAPKEEE
jgi:hypothetical protein